MSKPIEDFSEVHYQKLLKAKKQEDAIAKRSVLKEGPIGDYGRDQIMARPEYKKNDDRLRQAHLISSSRKHTPAELIKLMYECKGNMTAAASACKVTRMTFSRWIKADGNTGIIREMDEIHNDRAEEVLNYHVDMDDLDAAKFRLKTKAKDRGYTEKIEIDHSIVIEVKLEDSGE